MKLTIFEPLEGLNAFVKNDHLLYKCEYHRIDWLNKLIIT